MLCFKERIGVPILLFLIPFLFLAGCESADIQPASDSTQSSLNDSNSIIQTRLDGDHLEVFTLIPPSPDMQAMESIPDEVRAKDFLGGGDVLARNGTGNIRRLYSSWNLVTDEGSSTGARVDLDGEGLYVTDLGAEVTRSRVSLPSQAGTYYYRYLWANTKGSAFDYEYVYTISGDQATLTFGFPGSQSILYQGAPLGSADLGMGILISAFFGQAPEATQDSRYTGTWTITENFNGVTGETGKFDMRRIGIQNLQVEPGEFNPAADEQATISADVVALPVSTELTPDGWTPSGTIEWLIEVDDPAVARSVVRSLTGSVQPSNPDSNGKIATINQAWDGKDNAEMFVLNSEYIFRTQALVNLPFGNTISTEIPGAVTVGNLAVLVKNLEVSPEAFDPSKGEKSTLTFELEAIGFEDPNLSWKVEVFENEESQTPLFTFPEPEDPIQGSTTTVSLEWDGTTSSGTVTQDFEYRVQGRACESEVSARSVEPVRHRVLFQVDEGVCAFKTETIPGKISGISIENEKVTPDEPFSTNDSEAELTADIVVRESGDFDLFWTVSLQDASGNVGLKISEGEGSQISAVWDGRVNGVPVENPASYELLVEAYACPVELQLSEPTSDCLNTSKLVALGGNRAVISFFDLAGAEINEIEPSYAFQVVQSLDVVERNGQDPGSQSGEEIVTPKIQPSIVRVDIEFVSVRTRDESYIVGVEWDSIGAGLSSDGGHIHSNVAPSGILAKEKVDLQKDFDVLSSEEKGKIGDGGVSIAERDEILVDISSGERKITLYYLAPISSDLRRFTVLREGDRKEVGTKRLLVGFGGLEKLSSILTLSGVPFEIDPGKPSPEPSPPGGIVLTGQTSKHRDNLNGTPNFNARLAQLARLWIKNEDKRTLYYNDMSLPLGGKFSVNGTYEIRAMHTEHRVGENIDINTSITRSKKRDTRLEDYVIRAGLTVYDETEDNHYHVRLPKGGN